MSDAPLQPDRQILTGHIREFGKRVKLSGTAEELESFKYLERQIASYGYRTKLLLHDAYISLPGRAAVEIGGNAVRCITHSMSVSTPGEGISAEVIYVAEGAEADLEGIDAEGHISLVDGIATEDVAALASARGAIGQIHVSPNEHLYCQSARNVEPLSACNLHPPVGDQRLACPALAGVAEGRPSAGV
jgi:N-acetylated-alpha-linked acidic dipeptidase